MVVITVEAYQNARIDSVTVKNKDFFLGENETCTKD